MLKISQSGSRSARKLSPKSKRKQTTTVVEKKRASITREYYAQAYGPRLNDKLDPFLKPLKNQPASKLSQGPRDPRHLTYQKNDRSIWNVMDKMIAQRNMGMRIWHLCYLAVISSPTFYLHFRSVDDARKKYEQRVQEDFHKGIPRTTKRETAFALFLIYMKKNQSYFKAAFKGDDYLVLRKLIKHYRVTFVGDQIDDRAFAIYTGNLIGILYCWYKYDNMGDEVQDLYARKLISQRVMKF